MRLILLALSILLCVCPVAQGTTYRRLYLEELSKDAERIVVIEVTQKKESEAARHKSGLSLQEIVITGKEIETIRGDRLDTQFKVTVNRLAIWDRDKVKEYFGEEQLLDWSEHGPEKDRLESRGPMDCEAGKRYVVVYLPRIHTPFFFEVSVGSDEWRNKIQPSAPEGPGKKNKTEQSAPSDGKKTQK